MAYPTRCLGRQPRPPRPLWMAGCAGWLGRLSCYAVSPHMVCKAGSNMGGRTAPIDFNSPISSGTGAAGGNGRTCRLRATLSHVLPAHHAVPLPSPLSHPLVSAFDPNSPSLAALDRHRGLLRWHVHFNLVVLRMLSYGMDLHWARTKRATWCAEPTGTPPQPWHDLKVGLMHFKRQVYGHMSMYATCPR